MKRRRGTTSVLGRVERRGVGGRTGEEGECSVLRRRETGSRTGGEDRLEVQGPVHEEPLVLKQETDLEFRRILEIISRCLRGKTHLLS